MRKYLAGLGFNLALILCSPAFCAPTDQQAAEGENGDDIIDCEAVTRTTVGHCPITMESAPSLRKVLTQIDTDPPAAGLGSRKQGVDIGNSHWEWSDWDDQAGD